jgi:hypothetical protein
LGQGVRPAERDRVFVFTRICSRSICRTVKTPDRGPAGRLAGRPPACFDGARLAARADPLGRRKGAALTLHFCDEVFAAGARKSRRTREHPGSDLRTSQLPPAGPPVERAKTARLPCLRLHRYQNRLALAARLPRSGGL